MDVAKFGSNAWNEALKRQVSGRPPKFMVEETAYERMLREAGIHPDRAAEFLMVREWVKKNYTRHYVPENVLEAIGIKTDSVLYSERRVTS